MSRRKLALIATMLASVVLVASIQIYPIAKERSAWERTRQTGDEAAYNSYLREYPNGAHAPEAVRRVEYVAWRTAWQTHTRESYFTYKAVYPHGLFASYADEALSWLEKTPTWQHAPSTIALTFDVVLDGLEAEKGIVEAWTRGSLNCATQQFEEKPIDSSQTVRLFVKAHGRSLSQSYIAISRSGPPGPVPTKTIATAAIVSGEIRYEVPNQPVDRRVFSAEGKPPVSLSQPDWDRGTTYPFSHALALPGSFRSTLETLLVERLGPRAFPCDIAFRADEPDGPGHLLQMLKVGNPPVAGVAIFRLLDEPRFPLGLIVLLGRAGDSRAIPLLKYVKQTNSEEWENKRIDEALSQLTSK